MDLTDAQWALLDPLFRPLRLSDGRGRPWRDLPNRYPPYQTCHRRFHRWRRSGLLLRLPQKLAEDLRDHGKLDLSEAFVDASFTRRKKGPRNWPYSTR